MSVPFTGMIAAQILSAALSILSAETDFPSSHPINVIMLNKKINRTCPTNQLVSLVPDKYSIYIRWAWMDV